MGNVSSHLEESPYSVSDLDWAFTHPPLVLDVHNMPFLQPPEIEQFSSELDPIKRDLPSPLKNPPISSPTRDSGPLSPSNFDPQELCFDSQSSLSLPSSSSSAKTQWKSVQTQKPCYHLNELNEESTLSSPPLVARASIASQLSVLSATGPPSPKRTHSLKIGEILKTKYQFESQTINANIPPPVPPHSVFNESVKRSSTNSAMESALAVIESLEREVESDECSYRDRPRRRSVSLTRARSLSQSLSKQQSLSRSRSVSETSNSITSELPGARASKGSPTDIYTRKCGYASLLSHHPSSLDASSVPDLTKTDNSDSESDGPHSPKPYFALDGYSEGSTTLRVTNFASESPFLMDELEFPNTEIEPSLQLEPFQQYRVKSKALIAMEQELRTRKRYARYGHTFHGSGRLEPLLYDT